MFVYWRDAQGTWREAPYYPLMPAGLYLTDVMALGCEPDGSVGDAFTCNGMPVFTRENRDKVLRDVITPGSVLFHTAGAASHGLRGMPTLLQLHRAPPTSRKRERLDD
jgi:hypothetical protein